MRGWEQKNDEGRFDGEGASQNGIAREILLADFHTITSKNILNKLVVMGGMWRQEIRCLLLHRAKADGVGG